MLPGQRPFLLSRVSVYGYMDAPLFAKHPVGVGQQIKTAVIHSALKGGIRRWP